MKRRDILRLATAAAAVPVAPAGAQQRSPDLPKPQAKWAPSFFDEHQFQTVTALVDRIIPATDTPGAKAAQVDRHLDHLLAASPDEEKQPFREGLSWLDGYAIRTEGKPFSACAAGRQVAILETLDAAQGADLRPGREFFELAKRLTARLYYATETGFNELNKGGRVPATFGCPHPEHA